MLAEELRQRDDKREPVESASRGTSNSLGSSMLKYKLKNVLEDVQELDLHKRLVIIKDVATALHILHNQNQAHQSKCFEEHVYVIKHQQDESNRLFEVKLRKPSQQRYKSKCDISQQQSGDILQYGLFAIKVMTAIYLKPDNQLLQSLLHNFHAMDQADIESEVHALFELCLNFDGEDGELSLCKSSYLSVCELSLQCLGTEENRPDLECIVDWIESVQEDLSKRNSNHAVWPDSLQYVQQSTETVTFIHQYDDEGGYESDDSFYPPQKQPSDDNIDFNDEDKTSPDNKTSTSKSNNYRNKLSSFLAALDDEEDSAASPTTAAGRIQRFDSDNSSAASNLSTNDATADAKEPATRRPFKKGKRRLKRFSSLTRNEVNTFQQAWDKQKSNMWRSATCLKPRLVQERFDKQLLLSEDEASVLLLRSSALFRKEPNVLSLTTPLYIVGDLHGQYFDLTHIVSMVGMPAKRFEDHSEQSSAKYLFLGDYVDRGAFSCEVLFYLLSLKVEYPKSIHLIRGNHESDCVSSYFGFGRECKTKYGKKIFHQCLNLFQSLPIAALLTSNKGKFFCMHGGISPNVSSIKEVQCINRKKEPGMNGLLCDILWSDPVKDDDDALEGTASTDFIPNSSRGCSYKFTMKALHRFLVNNQLVGIIRAHEVQQNGYKFHFPELEKKGFVALTVFSAPNYCNTYGNQASYVLIKDDSEAATARDLIHPVQFDAMEQPMVHVHESVYEKRQDTMSSTCPYMPTTLYGFIKAAIQLGEDYGNADSRVNFPLNESFESPSMLDQVASPTPKKMLRSHNSIFDMAKASDSINEFHPNFQEQKLEEATVKLGSKLDCEESPDCGRPDTAIVNQLVNRRRSSTNSHDNLHEKKTADQGRGAKGQPNNSAKSVKNLFHLIFDKTKKHRLSITRNKGKTDSAIKHSRKRANTIDTRNLVENFAPWLSGLSGETVRGDSNEHFCSDLSDGVVLCRLMQRLPGTKLHSYKENTNKNLNEWHKRENLLTFQNSCKLIGIRNPFTATDLGTNKVDTVVSTLVQIARIVKTKASVLIVPDKLCNNAVPDAKQVASTASLAAAVLRVEQNLTNANSNTKTTALNVDATPPKPQSRAAALRLDVAASPFSSPKASQAVSSPFTSPGRRMLFRQGRQGSLENFNLESVESFSSQELYCLQLLFNMIDRSGDGLISANELVAWSVEEEEPITMNRANKCIQAVDIDGKKEINLIDFLFFASHMKQLHALSMQENAEKPAD